MDKQEIINIIEKHVLSYKRELKKAFPSIETFINERVSDDTKKFPEKLILYLYGQKICVICGKPTNFKGPLIGYSKYCSNTCRHVGKKVEPIQKTCPTCEKVFHTDKRHNRITCSDECKDIYLETSEVKKRRIENTKSAILKKYGVTHSSHIEGFKEKMKKTKLENHGDENYVNIDKAKRTKLSRYGDENYNNLSKNRETKFRNHGDENYNNREKFKKTNLDLFGVEYPIQNPEVYDLVRKKLTVKYGGVGFGSSEIKERIWNTNLDQYGNINPMKSSSVSDKAKKTSLEISYEEILSNSKRLGENVVLNFDKSSYFGTKGFLYDFKCNKCGATFIDNLRDGNIPVCRTCNPPKHNLNKPETEIYDFMLSNGLMENDMVLHTRSIVPPLELDIYIPSLKLAIEYDGIMWHSENFGQKPKNYHLHKTLACEKLGIKLIHIFEPEWEEQKEIVKSKIKSYILNSKNKIFARKCEIKEITSEEKSAFLEKNHLQGNDKSSIRIGAFYQNSLVAVMTFGNKRVALGNKTSIEGEYEMYRFCTETSVVGIGGKLFSYFVKKYNPLSVITFADRRFSSKNSFYEKIGFRYVSESPPNYWYFHYKEPFKLYHRFNFRKQELHKKLQTFDPSLTEWENMKNNGFDRIWDCGNYKFSWNKPI